MSSAAADEARIALLLQLRRAGIRDVDVLRAIETVPREAFLPEHLRHYANRNVAVPIPWGRTVPPPLAIATMLEALQVQPHHRVLEIGTGSGYATAVLARAARAVISCERYPAVAARAGETLSELGISAEIICGDPSSLPAQHGPFQRILVHASLPSVPASIAERLDEGGLIVAGVPADASGPAALAVFERDGAGFSTRRIAPWRLPPLEQGLGQPGAFALVRT